jgi:uncharacterized protein
MGIDPQIVDFPSSVDQLISLNVLMAIFQRIFAFLQVIFTELPALLKVVVFLGVWLGLWLPFAIPRSRCLKWRPGLPLLPEQRLPLLASLYLLAPIVVGITATIEKSSFLNYGFAWETATLVSVNQGFMVGVLGLALLFAVQAAWGWIDWTFPLHRLGELPSSIPSRLTAFMARSFSLFAPTFVLALWIGGTEELIFRGVVQNLLQPEYPVWGAAAIASLIFALLHLIWEIPETLPQIPGLWLMGMVLALARIVDGGSLGLAWGLHAGWVWGMVSLDTAGVVSYTGKIPEWVSGISGKPLAGILGIVLLLATGAVLGNYS